jgi:hypothetical protein
MHFLPVAAIAGKQPAFTLPLKLNGVTFFIGKFS